MLLSKSSFEIELGRAAQVPVISLTLFESFTTLSTEAAFLYIDCRDVSAGCEFHVYFIPSSNTFGPGIVI